MILSRNLGRISGNLLCALSMFLWSAAFPANEILLETWGTVTLSFLKFFMGVPVLFLIWIWIDGRDSIRDAPWIRGSVIGGIGFGIGSIIFIIGQDLSDAVTPAIAVAMMPIMGAILELVIEGRHLTLRLVTGIILAFGGGVLATGVKIGDANFGFGALLCLVATLFFAWGTQALTRNFPALSIMGQSTLSIFGGFVACALMLPVFFLFNIPGIEIGSLNNTNINLIMLIVLISMVVGQTIWMWGAGSLGILLASFHMNAVPFYVMVILIVLMDGSWNWMQGFGVVVIAAGVAIAQKDRFGD